MRVTIYILLTVLMTFCISWAGLYYIEIPSYITDDMIYNRYEEVEDELFNIIDRELYGKDEYIAVVIFTRNGEPIRPSSINADLNLEGYEIPHRTEPPHSNELEFLWCINHPYYWVLN
ncbi:MAG: hypothetical protein DRH51_04635 [Candidatus Coatesbacteria bacterium]|nr:MAG: hypothetical protein DRH51_04635 [Candidatus Coatesbacteria bacterium]